MTDDMEKPREDRVAELATAFALGEISEVELQELYDALREPGDLGRHAAGVAWRALDTHSELRVGLSTQFQDTLAHRLNHPISNRFTASLRRRMGQLPSGLSPVAAPGTQRSLPLWPFALVAVIVVTLALGTWWWSARVETVATVTEVQGQATIAGRALVPGTRLERLQVVVPAGSSVRWQWLAGGAAAGGITLSGPATAIPQGGGCSLVSGQAWITAGAQPATIGLPDAKLVLTPASRVAVTVTDQGSMIGVAAGSAAFGTPNAMQSLSAGQAATISAHWPWLQQAVPATTAWEVPVAGAVNWELSLSLTWPGEHELLALRSVATAEAPPLPAAPEMTAGIELTPGRLTIEHGTDRREQALPGAPLAAREVLIQRAGDRLTITVDGTVRYVGALPLNRPRLMLSQTSVLHSGQLRTGPATEPPAPLRWP